MPLVAPCALLAAVSLGACSPSENAPKGGNAASDVAGGSLTSPVTDNASQPANGADTAPPVAGRDVIGLEGLGDLKIGQAVPKGTSWAVRGAQESDACRTVSSPDYPGVYAIVTGNEVKRITVGARSTVKLAEGIGVGASESDVKKWFAGFRAEPHKYEDAPAKYLTAPNAAGGSSALRFEIGQDGKVKFIHVGLMPELALVEGCA